MNRSILYSCQWNYIGVTKKITYSTTRKEYVRNPKQFVKGPNSAKRAWTDNSTIVDKESNCIGITLAWNHGTWQKRTTWRTTTHAPTPEAILIEHSFKLTLILATLTFFRIVFPHFFLFQPGGGVMRIKKKNVCFFKRI